MFDDLTQEPSKQDLKDKIDELLEAIYESRDYILDMQNENGVLKNLYNESYQDAQRFSKIIKDVHEVIKDKKLVDDFKNTGIEAIINE